MTSRTLKVLSLNGRLVISDCAQRDLLFFGFLHLAALPSEGV